MRVAVQFSRDYEGAKEGELREMRDQRAASLQKRGILRIVPKPNGRKVSSHPDKMQRRYGVKG